jgi:hypothetical protein
VLPLDSTRQTLGWMNPAEKMADLLEEANEHA